MLPCVAIMSSSKKDAEHGRLCNLVGLCMRCAHVQIIHSDRGSTFYLCGVSKRDPRFAKYPRLPVIDCSAFADESSGEPSQ
jgi:hypothetical protein